MTKKDKILDNKKLSESIMDVGLISGTAKPGTIIASKSAKRIDNESIEKKINRRINKLLR